MALLKMLWEMLFQNGIILYVVLVDVGHDRLWMYHLLYGYVDCISRWNCTQDLTDSIPKLGKLGGTK